MSVVSKQLLCGLGQDEVHMPLLGLLVHCVFVKYKAVLKVQIGVAVWVGMITLFTESMSG